MIWKRLRKRRRGYGQWLLGAVLLGCGLLAGACATPHTFAASSLEQEVLAELNLARTDPRGYARHLREFRSYFQGKTYLLPGADMRIITHEGVAAVDEAIRFLQRQKPLAPLTWSPALSRAAGELAHEQGDTGATGHVGRASGGLKERVERHGRWGVLLGENINYGPHDARGVVMGLLVDDGVPDRGHRDNIFTPQFRRVGIACNGHRQYGTVCVMDFAGTIE